MHNVTFLIYFEGVENNIKRNVPSSLVDLRLGLLILTLRKTALRSARRNEDMSRASHVYSQSLLYIVSGDCCVVILSMYNVCFSSSDFIVP